MNNVLIAVPTRGQIQWATVTRLQEIRDAGGYPPILYEAGNLSVALTRNRVVQKFLRGDYDTLVMCDDDLVPTRRFLDQVLPLAEDWGVVGLPHPMQNPNDKSQIILTAFDGTFEDGLEPISDLEDGLNECAAVAIGCAAISREAIESVGRAPFRIDQDPATVMMSDDFHFCADVRDRGFRVGYWWDGEPCDHHTVAQLGALADARTFA